MLPSKLFICFLIGHTLYSCNNNTEVKATDVKLVSIIQTDSNPELPPPPPPPPPISNFMTFQEWLYKICDT
jgi:hypothetical protein